MLPAVEAELVEVEARCRRARAEAAVAWARAEEWRDAPALLEGSDAWLQAQGMDYVEWREAQRYETASLMMGLGNINLGAVVRATVEEYGLGAAESESVPDLSAP